MNVLLVVTGLASDKNPSGSSYNNRFAAALNAKGIGVTIIHLRAFSPSRNLIRFRKIDGNINVIELSCFLLYSVKNMPVFISIVLKVQMIRLKNSFLKNIDVVHAISGGSVAPAYMFSTYLNVPMISQFVGSDIAIQADYYKSLSLFNRGLAMSRALCFNSLGLRRDFEHHFDVNNEKKVLYRGIGLKEFPYCFEENRSPLVVLFLGGFPIGTPNLKGGITLLEAINMLDAIKFNRVVEIRIGGPNSLSQEYSALLKNKLQNKNIVINFIGSVQRTQVIEELSNSQIVLIPSLSEGIPNVLYEAMAAGNAIIASEVGGIPEFLNSETGILIESDNASELANSILSLVDDFSKITNFALKARSKIESYDYNSFVNDYISVYTS